MKLKTVLSVISILISQNALAWGLYEAAMTCDTYVSNNGVVTSQQPLRARLVIKSNFLNYPSLSYYIDGIEEAQAEIDFDGSKNIAVAKDGTVKARIILFRAGGMLYNRSKPRYDSYTGVSTSDVEYTSASLSRHEFKVTLGKMRVENKKATSSFAERLNCKLDQPMTPQGFMKLKEDFHIK